MREETVLKHLPLEIPHSKYPVEWWFFNGFFESENMGKRYFMVTFFRYNLAEKDMPAKTGHSVLLSVLNPETGENRTLSQIDEPVKKELIEYLKNFKHDKIDRDLIQALIHETKLHGPLRPVIEKLAESDFNENSFFISWHDLSLTQTENFFEITFPLLEDDESCTMRLFPQCELFDIDLNQEHGLSDKNVGYRCYPDMSAEGEIGNVPVTGKAWMDHQWGDSAWAAAPDNQKNLYGWDWFGINLDDGTHLIVHLYKEAETGNLSFSSAIKLDDNGNYTFLNGLKAEPIEFWESSSTRIRYPVSWKIEISELGLNIHFEPIVKNQEIMVFGLARAIWEGEGQIHGTMNGKQITGRARAEFYGYGFIFDFQNQVKRFADRVDYHIEQFLPKQMNEETIRHYAGQPDWQNDPDALTEMINKPVWDLIIRRGKRWRPIFGIWIQESLGRSADKYEQAISLIELFHTGSLIIDDIEDQSELRRGQPSLHIKYGLNTALNAGNTLYFLPFVELYHNKHLSDNRKLQLHQIYTDAFVKAHLGQSMDLYWSNHMNAENLEHWLNGDIESKILQMYDYKTASGPKRLAEFAAIRAGSDEPTKEAAVNFAMSFAVAFQLVDDVLNFSNSKKWSKVCGEDISSGKLTYAIVKAIRMLGETDSKRLRKILANQNLRQKKEILDEGVFLVKQSGALDVCKQEAEEMSRQAWDNFARIVPPSEPKIMLYLLCKKMLDMAYDT